MEETISALSYAEQAAGIKNRPQPHRGGLGVFGGFGLGASKGLGAFSSVSTFTLSSKP